MKYEKILALDPAQKTGWAHSNGEHGVLILQGDIGRQHAMLECNLVTMISNWGCDAIATENAGFGSNNENVAAMHNERLGVIRLVAARAGVPLKTFQPTSIKSFATGDGHADKSRMIRAAQRVLGITVISDDEADALWVLEFMKRPDCWPKPKAKVFKPRKKKSKLF